MSPTLFTALLRGSEENHIQLENSRRSLPPVPLKAVFVGKRVLGAWTPARMSSFNAGVSTFRKMTYLILMVILLMEIVYCVYYLRLSSDESVAAMWDMKRNVQLHASALPQTKIRGREMKTYLEQRAVRVKEVNCLRLFRGDREELQKALHLEHQPELLPTDAQIHDLASDCNRFLHHYGFLMDPLTDVENQFPIAFSILAYKDSSQAVDLLRAVYRPQNFYCLHADEKSSPDFKLALEAVSRCFPNVFMASRSVEVHWGFYTVIEPELVCMGDLWRNKTWKYFINLTGQEFPLKTNYELVRILTAYKGANDIPASVPSEAMAKRWKEFLPAPHNITVYKGSTHIVASRGFVDYMLHSTPAQDFLRWCQQTSHAAEHFFNSLNLNPHLRAPGRFLGEYTSTNVFKKAGGSLARYKNWVPRYPCPGKRVVRGICILNVLDLPMLYRRPQLFANKFHADYSRLALRCLAEELHNRTRDQTLGQRRFNVSIYKRFASYRQTY